MSNTLMDISKLIKKSLKNNKIHEDDKKIINELSPKMMLNAFYNYPEIVKYFNYRFNNYILYKLKASDLLQYVIDSPINVTDCWFTYDKKQKKDKNKKKLLNINDKEYKLWLDVCKKENRDISWLYGDDTEKSKSKKNSNILDALNESSETISEIKKGDFHNIRIPDKYYTDRYTLVDIQNKNWNFLNYIFYDHKTDKKHITQIRKNTYYYTSNDKISKPMIPINQCVAYEGDWKKIEGLTKLDVYEGDMDIETRHMIDYHFQKPGEKTYFPNVCYFDIETNPTDENGNYIDPFEPSCPAEINMIGYMYNDKITIRTTDKELQNLSIKEIKNRIFNKAKSTLKDLSVISDLSDWNIIVDVDQKSMVEGFIKEILTSKNIFILTAWNIEFDISYIIKKCEMYGIQNLLSKYGPYEFDNLNKYKKFHIPGLIVVDMLELYKGMHQNKKESYRLAYIADIELKNMSKLTMGNSIYELIVYNKRDVEILFEMDKKLSIFGLYDMVKKAAKISWKNVTNRMGPIEGLTISYLKENGFVARNNISDIIRKYNPDGVRGGYCQSCKTGGIREWICDFDAKSMYPSIIRTFNIGPNTLRLSVMGHDPNKPNIMETYILNKKSITDWDTTTYEVLINEFDIIKTTQSPNIMQLTLRQIDEIIKKNNYIVTVGGGIFCSHKEELSIYYSICHSLILNRDKIKNEYKRLGINHPDYMMNYLHQWALKILANAIFGVMGFDAFRYFCPTMANGITKSGREFGKHSLLGIEKNLEKMKNENNYNINNSYDFSYISDTFNKITHTDLQDDLNFKYAFYSDTDSTFVEFGPHLDKSKPIDEQLDKLIELTEKINDNIIHEIYKLHNLKDKQHQFMKYKNEWTAKRGIFYKFKKKRYGCYIIKKEGKPVDEMEIKGLDMIRSEFPVVTKNKLKELLELVIKKDSSISEIFNFVDNVENEFLNGIKSRNKNYCKRVSLSKPIEKYLTVSGHVKGITFWNSIYPNKKIRPGNVCYFYLTNGVDIMSCPKHIYEELEIQRSKHKSNKIDRFTIPEEEVLPEWLIIDHKSMLNYGWIDRYNNLLEDVCREENTMIDMLDDFDFDSF